MTTIIDRSLPESMIKLLRLALETGLDKVSLGFEGLGADFAAPIGWQIHLERVDSMLVDRESTERNCLTISAQIGSAASAYVGPHTSDDPYWYTDEIAAWITAPRTDTTGALLPDYSPAEKARFAQDAELFITAINNGWESARTLRRHEAVSLAKFMPGENKLPMVVSREFSALNWFDNEAGHPAHRDTGAKVSQNVCLGYKGPDAASPFFALLEATKINHDAALAMLYSQSPWFSPVAYFDDAKEEWVL